MIEAVLCFTSHSQACNWSPHMFFPYLPLSNKTFHLTPYNTLFSSFPSRQKRLPIDHNQNLSTLFPGSVPKGREHTFLLPLPFYNLSYLAERNVFSVAQKFYPVGISKSETEQDSVAFLDTEVFLCPSVLVCRKQASASMTFLVY